MSTMRKTHAEAALYSTTTSPASAHDSQAPSWMETGASQCIHDLLPARRVELHRGARGVEALANAFINASGERGPVDALAFQSRLTSGRRLWRASQILVSLPGTNARLAAFGLPQPLTGHRLPLVSRGERDSTGTVLWAFLVETLGNFGRTRRRQGHIHATTPRHLSAGVKCGLRTWPQVLVMRRKRRMSFGVKREVQVDTMKRRQKSDGITAKTRI